MSRVKNTKRNIIWSYVDYLISVLFSFLIRSITVNVLGDEYLGLSSLFTSILQVLNIAESGFSVAIVYSMYKPLAENDTQTVCSLLAYLKKVYKVIGGIVFFSGLVLMPFLPLLIKGEYPLGINVYLLYFLYLLNSSVSYFLFAYRESLLNALQRMDLAKLAYSLVRLLQSILQIVSVLVLKNYYIFVTSTILGTIVRNIITAIVSKKKYPQYYCNGEIDQVNKKNIRERVAGLLICNVSSITYTTFDSIILSSFLGLTAVAVYSNYLIIFDSVSNIIVLIRLAMQASVGNSVACETIEKNYDDLKKWQFLFSAIAIVCFTCLLCIYQPFMMMWMGDKMMLSQLDAILLSVLFFITVIQHSYYLYLSATGLWLELRWAYIISAVLNIVLNLILCKCLETTGVILATIIVNIISGVVWQSKIIFSRYFKKKISGYFKNQFIYLVVAIVSGGLAYLICNSITITGVIGLLIRLSICISISLFLIIICFRKTKVYSDCKHIALRMFSE